MGAGSTAASDEEMREILQEVTRLQLVGNLVSTLEEKERNKIKLNSESVKVRIIISSEIFSKTHQILLSMEKILTDIWRPFNGSQEERWNELTNQLKETMTGLGISEVEKRQVVAAMGPARGHWYSCPNGHVYNIGDCGGATVEANCPDCRERFQLQPNVIFSLKPPPGSEEQATDCLLLTELLDTWTPQHLTTISGGSRTDSLMDKMIPIIAFSNT